MWLPADFPFPRRVDLSTGHHLRPIREADVDIDLPAVMGSQARLWTIFGEAWGWPPATMTHEADRVDLARHEREIEAAQSFNFAVLDARGVGRPRLHLHRPAGQGRVRCRGLLVGGRRPRRLRPRPASSSGSSPSGWHRTGRSTDVCFIGRDVSWAEWLARPDVES